VRETHRIPLPPLDGEGFAPRRGRPRREEWRSHDRGTRKAGHGVRRKGWGDFRKPSSSAPHPASRRSATLPAQGEGGRTWCCLAAQISREKNFQSFSKNAIKPLHLFTKENREKNLSPLSDPDLDSEPSSPVRGRGLDPTLAHGGKSGASGGLRIVGAAARGGRPDRPSRTMAGLPARA
jgi:hypothetical protein